MNSGVDAVRYSFIVMDLHHLLLAGLPAHSALPPSTDIRSTPRHVRRVTNNGSRALTRYQKGRPEAALVFNPDYGGLGRHQRWL